jgi:hypothetical protein
MCYIYDNLGRVTARTIKNLSDNSVVSTETFNYDAKIGVGLFGWGFVLGITLPF